MRRCASVRTPPTPLSGGHRNGSSRTVLAALHGANELTVAELAASTGLSRPTVASAVSELTDLGWVEVCAPADGVERSAGRPARRVVFRSEAALVAGVDVGQSRITVFIAGLDGTILAEHEQAVTAPTSAAGRVDAVVAAVRAAQAKAAPTSGLLAVGIGSPGPMDGHGRVRSSPIIEWQGIDLGGRISRQLGVAAIVENDTMTAALAENHYGAGRGSGNFVYLHAGNRISSAVIIGGRLHRGFNGVAGMVGELDELRWHTAPQRLVAGSVGASSMIDVFRAAADDEVARDAVAAFADDLSLGLAAVVLAVDPELVVLGGGTSLAGPALAKMLSSRLAARAHLTAPRVEISSLRDRAVALGAVRLALDYAERHVLDIAQP